MLRMTTYLDEYEEHDELEYDEHDDEEREQDRDDPELTTFIMPNTTIPAFKLQTNN